MHLPSFLWLWRIAAWSMGVTLVLYGCLLLLGLWIRHRRLGTDPPVAWLRTAHISLGVGMVATVGLLLLIGIVGTLGHFGSLGHSWHLPAGLLVVGLSLLSAWTGLRIQTPKHRIIHIAMNVLLGMTLIWVLLTGWSVVQKYLPENNLTVPVVAERG
ncbi:MAG: DUF4079 domain-containing protein [Synechococcaceae cyanobacterium SM2_3_1]|nr:DUF4079 domain-containing protein [Synechococcaceae cyanobacterium SM2_3_1]